MPETPPLPENTVKKKTASVQPERFSVFQLYCLNAEKLVEAHAELACERNHQ